MPLRKTRALVIDPAQPDADAINVAASVLREGGLVAFPTETVYGLGADITQPEALARIFEAKGRPATNPLIVHVDGAAMAREVVALWPDEADVLATSYWPGPLTLVLPRGGSVPDVVTAGRETVAVRVPEGAIARGLISKLGRPIAAPSANRSCGVSPTLARHVLDDLDGLIELVIDGGACTLGLESTVVDLTTREPRVLRPGPITGEEISHVLGGLRVRDASGEPAAPDDVPAESPGRSETHYAPRTEAIRVEAVEDLPRWLGTDVTTIALILIGPHDPTDIPGKVDQLFHLTTPEAASHGLYAALRDCDALGVGRIVLVPPPDLPEWRALRDRARRATRPADD